MTQGLVDQKDSIVTVVSAVALLRTLAAMLAKFMSEGLLRDACSLQQHDMTIGKKRLDTAVLAVSRRDNHIISSEISRYLTPIVFNTMEDCDITENQ